MHAKIMEKHIKIATIVESEYYIDIKRSHQSVTSTESIEIRQRRLRPQPTRPFLTVRLMRS